MGSRCAGQYRADDGDSADESGDFHDSDAARVLEEQ